MKVGKPEVTSLEVNRITINAAAGIEEEERPLVSIPVAPMKDDLVMDGITLEIVVLAAPDLVVVAWMVNLLIRNVKIECSNFSHLKFMMLMKTNDMKYR